MREKTFWPLINADERGFMNGNDFVFSISVHPCSSAANLALDFFRSLCQPAPHEI
jgi:hypothetical protein